MNLPKIFKTSNPVIANVVEASGEVVEVVRGNWREVHATPTDSAVNAGAVPSDALADFLAAQDALDNHELNGQNGTDYFTLVRRRNDARKDLDAALATKADSSEQKAQPLTDELRAKATKMAYAKWTTVGINVNSLQWVLREVLNGIASSTKEDK